MAVQTLIGLKRLTAAKQRLMPQVSPVERRQLMLAMLTTVVGAALDAGLGPVALATSEPTAPALGWQLGVAVISDAALPWNEGLVHALRSINPRPAAVMQLAADLPLLTTAELRGFAAAAPSRGVCVARARDGGTNALLVAPSDSLRPSFGRPRSSAVHEQAARDLGLACAIVDLPGLALDVDTVVDAWDAGLIPRPLSERDPAQAHG